MAKFVRFNTNTRVSGVPFSAGDEKVIDDIEFAQLVRLQRSGKPYITELPMPVIETVKKVEQKPKKKRKKETATAVPSENTSS